MHTRSFLNSTLVLLAAGLLTGCSDKSVPSEALTGGVTQDNTYAVADDQLAMSGDAGIDVDGSAGIFSVGWHQFAGPMDQSPTTRGDAMAVVFDGTQSGTAPHRTQSGINIGTVFLNYGSTHQELSKKEGYQHGTFYSLFPKRPEPTDAGLVFIPGGTYEFEVTGSDRFSPLKVSLTAPPALINFTSHANGDSISASSDLTITWSGGSPASGILVRLTPDMPPPPRPGEGGAGNGGQHPGPGMGDPHEGVGPAGGLPLVGNGQHPGPMQIEKGYIRKLSSNPGTFTIPNSELQLLLKKTGRKRIAVMVSEVNDTSIDHEGKTYRLVVRNGDRRVLTVH